MNSADVLATVRALLLTNDHVARQGLADMFEELKDEEMVNLLRKGLEVCVVWGTDSTIFNCSPTVDQALERIETYGFHSLEAKRAFETALMEHDGWTDCCSGTEEKVEEYVRSLYDDEDESLSVEPDDELSDLPPLEL
jgi:hypothetical protein